MDVGSAAPGPAYERGDVQPEIAEGHNRAEPMERPSRLGSADEVEHHFRPAGIIELERHAGDYQQQEARDHEEVQEALEGQEAGEPLAAFLRADLRLAEPL